MENNKNENINNIGVQPEKKSKAVSVATIVLFVLLIFGITIAGFFVPSKERSESENRNLAQKPEFTIAGLFEEDDSKRFTTQYESYLTDQFIARDTWISIKTFAEKTLGKTDNNGVYYAKDGYLITKTEPDDVDPEKAEKNINRVIKFAQTYMGRFGKDKVHVMIIPTAAKILEDKLPAFTTEYDQDALLARFKEALGDNFIDVTGELEAHKDEYLFYRSDHHWTALGAYYAYRAWAEQTGRPVREQNAYQVEVGSDEFLGTLYSKINYPMQKDTVTLYKDGKNYSVEFDRTGRKQKGLFVESRLEEKDKYMVYLDGNHALTHIVNLEKATSQTANRRLLVVKDSYAHTYVPFIAQDYAEVVMVDFRYCKVAIPQLIAQYRITDLLVLYNATNVVQEDTLYMLE